MDSSTRITASMSQDTKMLGKSSSKKSIKAWEEDISVSRRLWRKSQGTTTGKKWHQASKDSSSHATCVREPRALHRNLSDYLTQSQHQPTNSTHVPWTLSCHFQSQMK